MPRPRPITLKALARELGVSPTTVSFVLNGREQGISDAVARKVWEAACAHGLVRSGRPRQPDQLRVAYVLRDAASLTGATTFFQNFYRELQLQGVRSGCEVMLRELNPAAPPAQYFTQYETLLREEFDVCVTCDGELARFLAGHDNKVILCQAGATVPGLINIYCDDYTAGRLAAEYLYGMGHREAGMVFFRTYSSNTRFDGFHERFLELGGRCREDAVWYIDTNASTAETELIQWIPACRLLPRAFYCYADNIMFPFLRALAHYGIRVPDDVSIIGTDNLWWGRVACPAFTTVDLHEDRFAAIVLEHIHRAVHDYQPAEIAVPVSLLVRESVAPGPAFATTAVTPSGLDGTGAPASPPANNSRAPAATPAAVRRRKKKE